MYSKLIPGRAARPLAAAAVAALLAGIVISGCGTSSGGVTTGPGTGTTTTAAKAGTLTKASGSGGCNEWPGVGDLNATALPLRQLANDDEIYGPGSDQANSDGMAVTTAEMGLNQIVTQLPYPWAQAIMNDVLSVGPASSPEELNTAANNAVSLATTISQMCYTP